MNKLESMRYAGRINRLAIDYGFEYARPGISKLDLNNRLDDFIRSYGCEPAFLGYMGFPKSACICINEEIVHGIPNDRIIQDGDILTIDIGTKYRGWNVDAARTDVVGKSTNYNLDFVRNSEKIFKELIRHIHPNFSLFQIAELCDRLTAQYGYHILNEFCGHGIGTTVHMEPDIFHSLNRLNSDTIGKMKTTFLPVGATICVEPVFIRTPNIGHSLSEDGWTWISNYNLMSTHFEHTLLITESGAEIIS